MPEQAVCRRNGGFQAVDAGKAHKECAITVQGNCKPVKGVSEESQGTGSTDTDVMDIAAICRPSARIAGVEPCNRQDQRGHAV